MGRGRSDGSVEVESHPESLSFVSSVCECDESYISSDLCT